MLTTLCQEKKLSHLHIAAAGRQILSNQATHTWKYIDSIGILNIKAARYGQWPTSGVAPQQINT